MNDNMDLGERSTPSRERDRTFFNIHFSCSERAAGIVHCRPWRRGNLPIENQACLHVSVLLALSRFWDDSSDALVLR